MFAYTHMLKLTAKIGLCINYSMDWGYYALSIHEI